MPQTPETPGPHEAPTEPAPAAEAGPEPERARHRPRRDADRWSRFGDEGEPMEDAVA